jgi:hypothetical protein
MSTACCIFDVMRHDDDDDAISPKGLSGQIP